jgi:hypothetical protein
LPLAAHRRRGTEPITSPAVPAQCFFPIPNVTPRFASTVRVVAKVVLCVDALIGAAQLKTSTLKSRFFFRLNEFVKIEKNQKQQKHVLYFSLHLPLKNTIRPKSVFFSFLEKKEVFWPNCIFEWQVP